MIKASRRIIVNKTTTLSIDGPATKKSISEMMDSFGRSHESSIESVGDDGRRKDGSRITNSFGHVHLSKTKLVSQDRGAQDSATQQLPCTV